MPNVLINRKIVLTNKYDYDAIAFIVAAGITDANQKNAINNLVIAAKKNDWWARCVAIYSYIGGTASSTKYNLKDSRDLDAAFRITWTGTLTYANTGVTSNGTTGFGNTWVVPSVNLANNDAHWSVYSRTNNTSGLADCGVSIDSLVNFFAGSAKVDSTTGRSWITAGAQEIVPTVTDSRGWFLGSRISSTSHVFYQNGVSSASSATANSGTAPAYSIFLHAYHTGTADSSVGGFSVRELSFATFGSGIGGTLAVKMYNDIQRFQTALGRQV